MVMHTSGGAKLILLGKLVGFVLAIIVLAISAESVPMMLDRACTSFLAVQTSLCVVLRNPGTMALWGSIAAGSLTLGCLPLFVGLAIVMPILGYATWHLYRRAVV